VAGPAPVFPGRDTDHTARRDAVVPVLHVDEQEGS
jgi:hypothetical protein